MALYCVSSVFGIATIAAGIGQYITFFSLPSVLLIEIILLAVFCWVNIAGIAFSGMTENILTALKIIPLVIISLLLLPFIRFENFVPVGTPDSNRAACHHHYRLLAVYRF